MGRRLQFLLGALAGVAGGLPAGAAPRTAVVIPVRDEISAPEVYIIRAGLKQAQAEHADAVVLDLKTPGGDLASAQDIMEALAHYHGKTIAYVDNEAMSAGAFISAATDEIWFTPDGIIGAAAPVTATGQDVDATMKQKLVSYLKARMRAVSEGKGYRGEVISAMIDSDYELKIDGKEIKSKDQLLSLTAAEAMKTYGQPPRPLLGTGIAPDLDALLARQFGPGQTTVQQLEVSWSEHLAVVLNQLAPVLLGLGLFALFLEFKMPGSHFFAITGVALLALVFAGSHLAGLSGHEPVLFFALGAILVLLELIFWHSAGFLGVGGVALMGAAIVWSMADLWPDEPLHAAWSADAFVRPLTNLGFGVLIATALGAALLRYLPKGWVWDRMVIGAASGGRAQAAGSDPATGVVRLIGRQARVATALRPAGQVEIDGRRYEAMVDFGTVEAGATVRISGQSDFGLKVERADA
ncbi:MAG TPA: NfeD family protein [Opitutaceae bacterium]|nr:NfeD family protein [Opitutaceae bacterium]